MNPKANKIIIWIIIGLMTLQFLAAGLAKFRDMWTERFVEWGYPEFSVYLVGLIEVLAVVALYLKKFRHWAIAILVVTMIGAGVTHVMNGESSRLIHNGVIILLLVALYKLGQNKTEATE